MKVITYCQALQSKKVLETTSTLLVFSLASTKGLKTAFKMAAVTVSKMDRWLGYKLGIDQGADDGIVTCLTPSDKQVTNQSSATYAIPNL